MSTLNASPAEAPTTVTPQSETGEADKKATKIDWVSSVPFFGVHLACVAAVWTGISWTAIGLCLGAYWLRMFAVTGGYHRYFAHKSYKTSRAFQFVLAWLGCSAVQKGPLWWAGHHRHHHKHSDDEHDLHSPRHRGFWFAHVGWILCRKHDNTNFSRIKDFAKFPELRWLNRYHLVPAVSFAVLTWLIGGWSGLIWGFFISTVMLYHSTFVINSLCHVFGTRRYDTPDTSRNSLWMALLTMGEGWHNNHHYYDACARQGFFWWEIDLTYYVLKVLSWCRVVTGLRQPPRSVLEGRFGKYGKVSKAAAVAA